MESKHLKRSGALLAIALFWAGCQTVPDADEGAPDNASAEQSAQTAEDENQGGGGAYYQPFIRDNRYVVSSSRGLMSGNSSQANQMNMETQMYRLMQDTFPTDQYVLQEGQAVNEDILSEWLARKSKDHPNGLNPEQADAPKYLNTMLEYDLYHASGDENQTLGGIALAIAINDSDQLNDDQEAVAIDQKTALKQGKAIAQEVLNRLRNNKKYVDVPIQFFIFHNAPADDISGGEMISSTVVSEDSTSFGDWSDTNTMNVAYGAEEAPNKEDSTLFERYRNDIEDFFPELSGLAGIGHYKDGRLGALDITINTPVNGYSETVALLTHAGEVANNTFNQGIRITITTKGPSGITGQATREAKAANFTIQPTVN
ncbi:MAG: CamS family sex pheromone protein [Aerococcus sp.]|nr:CamS family sex pheromone protein [Aerococcus sp.]